jgi:methylmalonyl-CoA epimerase
MYKKIDHIVVRVGNLGEAIDDYENKLGMVVTDGPIERPELNLTRAYLALGTSDTFIELVQPLSDEGAIATALARNGEGVHAVALVVDDRAAAAAAAKANGAQVIETSTQSFIHPRDGHGVMLQLTERTDSMVPGTGAWKWIDHMVVRVRDLDAAASGYADKLGLKTTRGPEEQPGIGLRRVVINLGDSGRFLELAEPLGENSAIGKSIEKRGEGVHLVALAVGDLAAAAQTLKQNGARVIEAGSQIFVHPSVGHGVMYQLIERP